MEHTPVLLRECVDYLNIKPGGLYVDGTYGNGGHSREILKRLHGGRLIAIDRDAQAIAGAVDLPPELRERIDLVHGNFRDLASILECKNIKRVDGMLFDLGVSSMQIDNPERGFSHMRDAALDMRMDTGEEMTAYDAVNNWPEDKLRRVFYEYGEERYASGIARAIVRKRAGAPIKTTFDLNAVIISAIPQAARREAQHPSKRCFQALRIAVNDELGAIGEMLGAAPLMLNTGGRICVISFHSLEDRLVKNAFAAQAQGCTCPKDFPVCVCGGMPVMKVITKKPVTPSDSEIELNRRSRSAKLRVAERL